MCHSLVGDHFIEQVSRTLSDTSAARRRPELYSATACAFASSPLLTISSTERVWLALWRQIGYQQTTSGPL
jgi:hypothetical protein